MGTSGRRADAVLGDNPVTFSKTFGSNNPLTLTWLTELVRAARNARDRTNVDLRESSMRKSLEDVRTRVPFGPREVIAAKPAETGSALRVARSK